MRCKMEYKEHIQSENMDLLMEIFNLKTILSELNAQTGPNSSNYLNLSLKLKLLERKYMDEKMNMYKDTFIEMLKGDESPYNEIKETSIKSDPVSNKYKRTRSWSFIVNR